MYLRKECGASLLAAASLTKCGPPIIYLAREDTYNRLLVFVPRMSYPI